MEAMTVTLQIRLIGHGSSDADFDKHLVILSLRKTFMDVLNPLYGPFYVEVGIASVGVDKYVRLLNDYWSEFLTGKIDFNPLNAELNPNCCLLALLGAHLIFHISRVRVDEHASVYRA